jgi:uncharacterized protein YfiM (DUF2279 family)
VNWKNTLFSLLLIGLFYSAKAQVLDTNRINKKRLIPSSIAIGSVWASGIAGLSQVWYKDFKKTKLHSFDDGKDWLQMDKAGHIYTAFHLSEANYRLFKWTGLSETQSMWIGAGIGFGFQTSLEFLDGRNAGWGFSWYDMAANAIGTSWFLGQQSLWKVQRLLLKFSYHPTEFAQYRPAVLGSNFSERFFKDYNGQSYWLSFSPKQFNENWILPSWLCLSFGYSVEEKLVGDQEIYVNNNLVFQSRRQYLFSLDLDVRELPVENKWLKAILRPLHYVKIPFPALILDGNKLTGSWMYF